MILELPSLISDKFNKYGGFGFEFMSDNVVERTGVENHQVLLISEQKYNSNWQLVACKGHGIELKRINSNKKRLSYSEFSKSKVECIG